MPQFLPHRVLTSLKDAEENFDAIDGYGFDTAATHSATDFLQFITAGSGYKLFVQQSVSLSFSASTKAAEVAVTHNLGAVPQAIIVTPIGDPGVVLAPYGKNGASTTTATIGAYTTSAITATKTVSVVIIG